MSSRTSLTGKRTWLATLLACGVLALPAAAAASVGTGVGASPIILAQRALPGHAYRLPGLYVLNTGTVASRYHVRVQRLTPGGQNTLPGRWVTLAQNDFLLRPRHSTMVAFTIRVPNHALAGPYLSDLVASTVSARHPGSTAVGAAAATKLGLTVSQTPGSIPWGTIGLAALAGLLVATAMYGIRWSGLHVRFERH
jgi:hypothetical protein